MGKRFTATEKWNDRWFRALEQKYKLLHLYILDACDNAGIWEADLDLARFYLGSTFKQEEVLSIFGERIAVLPDGKWFLTKFIPFQYKELRKDAPAHKPVIARLQKYGLIDEELRVSIEYGKSIDTHKDKEKETDKDTETDKEKGVPPPQINVPFETFWSLYDKKVGDKRTLSGKWERLTDEERLLAMDYIPKYKDSTPDKKYRKNPETFLNQRGWEQEIIFSGGMNGTTKTVGRRNAMPDPDVIARI